MGAPRSIGSRGCPMGPIVFMGRSARHKGKRPRRLLWLASIAPGRMTIELSSDVDSLPGARLLGPCRPINMNNPR
jgi:hypothetical protein